MESIQHIGKLNNSGFSKPVIGDLRIYKEGLKISPEAIKYLNVDRNLLTETFEHFNIGYDFMRNQITIPEIKDKEFINIAFRSLEDKPKEKYTKQKGCENWIFNEDGIEQAKKNGGILITSNQFDCMSAYQVGIKNVVSIPVIGKNATGEWIEMFENIPKIYISFENNKKMKKFAMDFADRLGVDKCFEIELPEGVPDMNSYFKSYTKDDFKNLIRKAKPFYKYTYQDLGSVLDSIVAKGDTRIEIDILPFIKLDVDYLLMISGLPGIGKTSFVMNIANKLMNLDIPTMIVPYERGARAVGERFIGIHFNKTEDEIKSLTEEDVKLMRPKLEALPLYFSVPDIERMRTTVERAKKLFGVRAIIVDHLEYNVSTGSKNSSEVDKLKVVMTEWKNICIDLGVMFFVVHHVRKGQQGSVKRELTMEDMVGGGTPQRVAEAVIMLSTDEDENLKVSVVKNNHGAKGSKTFKFNGSTGKIEGETEFRTQAQKALDEF